MNNCLNCEWEHNDVCVCDKSTYCTDFVNEYMICNKFKEKKNMYYIYIENDQINGCGQCQCSNCLNIEVDKEIYDDFIENPDKYINQDGKIIINPNYEAQQQKKLEKEFDSHFFEIPNFGYFRRIPKGYNSAVESLNTVCSAVTFMKSLPEGILTFYRKPDFTKPEQCTEEWITNNSYKNKAMTLDEFAVFYTTFITAWNTQEHL